MKALLAAISLCLMGCMLYGTHFIAATLVVNQVHSWPADQPRIYEAFEIVGFEPRIAGIALFAVGALLLVYIAIESNMIDSE